MHKQPEVTAATRQNIMDSFFSIYKETRLEKITVTKISSVAKINRSTFYQYFTDVYDLLNQYENALLEELAATLTASFSGKPFKNPTKYTEQLSKTMFPYIEKVYYLRKNNSCFEYKTAKIMKPVFFNMNGLSPDSLKTDYLFTLTLSTIFTNISYWYEHRAEITLDELLLEFRNFVADL